MDYSKENDTEAIKDIFKGIYRYQNRPKVIDHNWTIYIVIMSIMLLLLIFSCTQSFAYTDDEIVNAIYKAEGGKKAQYPFGIRSVNCDGYDDCRQVCLNTVRNNRKRYADYGHKKYDTYLEFLASRYAPVGADNDPKNLNKNWIKNVTLFLENK